MNPDICLGTFLGFTSLVKDPLRWVSLGKGDTPIVSLLVASLEVAAVNPGNSTREWLPHPHHLPPSPQIRIPGLHFLCLMAQSALERSQRHRPLQEAL